MTSDLPTPANVPDLDAIAEKWLRLCGACDAGMGSCVCPPGDPRNVIDNLVEEVKRVRAELSQVREELDAVQATATMRAGQLTAARRHADEARSALAALREAYAELSDEHDATNVAHGRDMESWRRDADALAALRAEVGKIADKRAAQAKRLGPLTDETSGPDRVAWLICDEDASQLRALAVNTAGVKSH